MDLLLHVGLHKTGTTTVQEFLYKNRHELLSKGIYYPEIIARGHQHMLIPNLYRCPRFGIDFLSLKNCLTKLEKTLIEYKPSLTIMSSECWSEMLDRNNAFSDFISKIRPLFNKITLFVSKRNFDSLALSALKHHIRHERNHVFIKNKKYIYFYFELFESCIRVFDFWENYELPFISKNLEDSSGNLVDHYFGDIIETYNQDARKILQNNKEEIINQDLTKPYTYLNMIVLGSDNSLDPVFTKFMKDHSQNIKSITNEQIILFFKYFKEEYEKNNLDNLTLKDRINAFEYIIKL